MTGIRAQNRATMQASILRLGREHLRTHGAARLSLRAIARDLGVVSSAVYRYVPSRDELLTLLLVEAYTDLADAVDAAIAQNADADHAERIFTAATAVHTWAIGDPARWTLLYGSPVPGYAAPAEQTVPPGTRVIGRLLSELADAYAVGALRDDLPTTPVTLNPDLDSIRAEFHIDLPNPLLIRATTLWSTLIGAVSLEVFGQYGNPGFRDAAGLFGIQIRASISALFRDS